MTIPQQVTLSFWPIYVMHKRIIKKLSDVKKFPRSHTHDPPPPPPNCRPTPTPTKFSVRLFTKMSLFSNTISDFIFQNSMDFMRGFVTNNQAFITIVS